MWAELGHCHYLYVPAVLKVVTYGNSTNRALGFEFSIQSSVYAATAVAKVSLFSYLDMLYCKFLLYVSVEIDPLSCGTNIGNLAPKLTFFT